MLRRAGLGAVLALLAASVWFWAATAQQANASGEVRTLSLYEIHTKETLTVTYKRDGKFDEDALKQINNFMRDWRRDEARQMDRELIDVIWTLHRQLGSQEPIHFISGYRSAATNAALRKRGGGQARKSQHILGKAADIHFPDVPVRRLRNSALVQEVGGVGYYPTSGIPFVHVDTGRVRMWPRIPRLDLAALFPSGKTGYLPTDGKPITVTDYKIALAKGRVRGRTLVAAAAPRPKVETPGPILASFTPNASALLAPPAATPPGPRAPVPAPLYRSAEVVGAPEVDDDHPDELSYVPFETASLMTDISVTYNRSITAMIHPEQKNLDYLFDDMDRPIALSFRASSGYRGLAAAQRFSGGAVRSLYADPEAPAPTQLAQGTR
jgi:uncharacterized protein YcbK (DUF882 family)